ncbi:MAG: glycosyltransferase family 2 protein [Sphingomonadaceae bacterium]
MSGKSHWFTALISRYTTKGLSPRELRPEPLDATAIIITFNEEQHIQRCIARIRDHVKRVVIIDSFSTDRTCEIADVMGADVIQHPFVTHAAQFNWGAKNCGVETEWIIRLDADEYFDVEGIAALRETLEDVGPEVSALSFRRMVIFKDKLIRFGGIGRVFLTRVWRNGIARVETRWMDEQVLVDRGKTLQIGKGAIIDENLNSMHWWTEKHNGYATRQMVQSMLVELNDADQVNLSYLNPSARRKRFLREGVYARTPLFLRAVLYFFYRYFLAMGFLDGRRGFLFHFFQGLWNFFLVDVKIYEARRAIRKSTGDYAAFSDWVYTTYGIVLETAKK